MKLSQILINAKALIANEENWTQRHYHETINDKQCHCALGAVSIAMNLPYSSQVIGTDAAKILQEVESVWLIDKCGQKDDGTPQATFAQYNDNHSHSEVLASFDKAIALAESREK